MAPPWDHLLWQIAVFMSVGLMVLCSLQVLLWRFRKPYEATQSHALVVVFCFLFALVLFIISVFSMMATA
jgi:hypothetical protein